jgi:choline dehydrogenase
MNHEYIVVGSGAGGGPLAARLAELGHRVLLLEAGGDEEPWNYQVPAFHGLATEDEAMRLDHYVRHYADEARQSRDPNYEPARKGVFYPRARTLGGCTAHYAMMIVRPHDSDWQAICDATGDASWSPTAMNKYFGSVERCLYRLGSSEGFERFGDARTRRRTGAAVRDRIPPPPPDNASQAGFADSAEGTCLGSTFSACRVSFSV